MDFEKLEWLQDAIGVIDETDEVFEIVIFKVKSVPAINVFLKVETDQFIAVEIDEDCNFEVDYSVLHWWSDWNGEEVGYDEVLVVGLYALKDFPNIEIYLDVENQKILEAWLIEDDYF